jgi:hypothetical protein
MIAKENSKRYFKILFGNSKWYKGENNVKKDEI